jgi:23S rRNA (adenine2030-N6)-methyltransferase
MDIAANDHLRIEFDLGDPSKGGMTGSGLWVINPPFTLEKSLKIALDSLCEVINPGLSSYLLEASSKKS